MCPLGDVVMSDCLDFVGYSAKRNWSYVSASEVLPHAAITNLQGASESTFMLFYFKFFAFPFFFIFEIWILCRDARKLDKVEVIIIFLAKDFFFQYT